MGKRSMFVGPGRTSTPDSWARLTPEERERFRPGIAQVRGGEAAGPESKTARRAADRRPAARARARPRAGLARARARAVATPLRLRRDYSAMAGSGSGRRPDASHLRPI
jgi:hypothetical protein